MQDFTRLKVWQKAHNLTVNVYKVSAEFPSEERFGLTNQLRRAVVSVESNIAEGAGRDSDRQFKVFLDIAQGSCYEVKCQIFIARDLGYLDNAKSDLFISKIDEVMKMIYSLKLKLKATWFPNGKKLKAKSYYVKACR